MAVTAGPAGYGTVGAASTALMSAENATSVWVKCCTSSTNSLLVNIPTPNLHSTSWFKLEAGDAFIARFGYLADFTINAKSIDGTSDASVSWAICAKLGG